MLQANREQALNDGGHSRRTSVAWFLFFTALALGSRLLELGSNSFRFDEGITFFKSQLDFDALIFSPTDNKPPVYYILTKPFFLLGDSEFILRLPSAVLMALSVGASYYLGRELGGRSGSLILPLLLVVQDVSLEISQDARHYSLLTLSIVLVAIALIRLLRGLQGPSGVWNYLGTQRWSAALLAFSMVAALYSHTIAVYYLFTMVLAAVVHSALIGRWRTFIPSLVLLGATVFIIWLPWFRVFVGLVSQNETFTHQEWLSAGEAMSHFLGLFGVRFVWRFGHIPEVVMFLFALAGIFLLARKQKGGCAWILGLGLFLTPLLIWVTGIEKPIFNWRTVGPGHIFAAAAIAAFPANLGFAKLRGFIVIGVLLIWAKSSYGYYMTFKKEQWRETVQYLSSVAGEKDLVIICAPWSYHALMYYWREPQAIVGAVGEETLHQIDWKLAWKAVDAQMRGLPTELPEIGREQLGATRDLYLIDRQEQCDGRPVATVLGNLGIHLSTPHETVRFTGISVMRFTLN